MKEFLRVSPEAADALAGGRAVVAFESTIISHGMPHPLNIETALGAERIAREMGVVPATVGVLDGRIVVGLGRSEIKLLATEKGVLKVSRRDISWALARGLPGATTVCATMFAAHLAGIGVFATGGIGGVHRGARAAARSAATFDVSADLGELGRTPVCVVSAGAKAVLDLPATLEVLETAGVPVVGFRTREFPAFWSRSSGLPLGLSRRVGRRGGAHDRRAPVARPPAGHPGGQPRARRARDPARGDGDARAARGAGAGVAEDHGQGGHPLPARPDRGAHRGPGPRDERTPLPSQRAPRLRDRDRAREAAEGPGDDGKGSRSP